MPYLLFLKNQQNLNCRLLQIIGGALRVEIKNYCIKMYGIIPPECKGLREIIFMVDNIPTV